jgi:hypothetical protein
VISPSTTKACPACAEQIQIAAKKCRFCGTEFVTIVDPKKLKANNHSSYGLYTVICILIPIVGIILGIVCLTKSDPLEKKLGEHALAFSIVMMILYSLLLAFLWYTMQEEKNKEELLAELKKISLQSSHGEQKLSSMAPVYAQLIILMGREAEEQSIKNNELAKKTADLTKGLHTFTIWLIVLTVVQVILGFASYFRWLFIILPAFHHSSKVSFTMKKTTKNNQKRGNVCHLEP